MTSARISPEPVLCAICLWCGAGITKIGGLWRHDGDDDAHRFIFCDCHCEHCDPRGGYTDGRRCIAEEEARPDLLTIRTKVNRG